MANGVKFGSYHSSNDLSLFLNSKDIGVPKAKENRIDIPARSGSLDLTEFFGGVKYDDRDLSFTFTKIGGDFVEVFSDIQNLLHGKSMNIVLDSDPNYYYKGRVFIKKWSSNATTGIIDIECTCEPYKLKLLPTVIEKTIGVSGEVVILCNNQRMPTVPKITVTAAVTIGFGTSSYSVNAGTHTINSIVFTEGNNLLTFTGASGTGISIEYQEGAI